MFSEETDWCYRFRQAGWGVLFTPDAEFVHVGGATTRQNWGPMFREQRARSPALPRQAPRRAGGRACAAAARRLAAAARRCLPRRARAHVRGGRPLAGGVLDRRAAGVARMTAPALVVDVGWVNGLAAIRSLGRAGVRVLARRPPAERARLPLALRAARADARPAGRGSVRRLPGRARARGARAALPHPRRAAERDRARARACSASASSTRSRPGRCSRGSRASAPARGRRGGRDSRAAHRLPGLGCRGRGAAERARLPGAGQAVRRRRASSGASAARPSAARPRPRSSAAYADAEPYEPMVQELIPGGDDELYTLGSATSSADGEALGVFSRPQAAPDAARRGHVPRRRGGLGRRGGRPGADAAARARLPRALAGRVQARPARRRASS